MRSANFITKTDELSKQRLKDAKTQSCRTEAFGVISLLFVACVLLCSSAVSSFAQRVGILTPDKSELSEKFSASLAESLGDKLTVLDNDLCSAAFASVSVADPFNMTADESRRAGAVIGSDLLILLKAATQRRSAFGRTDYYEAFAPIYLVSSRTGRLIHWRLLTFEAAKSEVAEQMLYASAATLARTLEALMTAETKERLTEPDPPTIEEVPDQGSPAAKNFRAPIPYRRIKPEYTTMAALYDVTATVEILVDTDATGAITRTEIVRWAGYGLDGSVEKTVREMNWRPAERNGKPLAMRFLLRYNFKKIPKDTE